VKEMSDALTAEELARVVRESVAARRTDRPTTEDRVSRIRAASDPTLRWFVPKWRWIITLSWTNWTFGFYWGKIGNKYMIGVDFGPLEIVRRREFIVSDRAKHRLRA
jgi:hypothetical protein